MTRDGWKFVPQRPTRPSRVCVLTDTDLTENILSTDHRPVRPVTGVYPNDWLKPHRGGNPTVTTWHGPCSVLPWASVDRNLATTDKEKA